MLTTTKPRLLLMIRLVLDIPVDTKTCLRIPWSPARGSSARGASSAGRSAREWWRSTCTRPTPDWDTTGRKRSPSSRRSWRWWRTSICVRPRFVSVRGWWAWPEWWPCRNWRQLGSTANPRAWGRWQRSRCGRHLPTFASTWCPDSKSSEWSEIKHKDQSKIKTS